MRASNIPRNAGWWLLAASVLIYAVGIYLTQLYLCQSVGPNVLLVAVVVGALSCFALVSSAIQRRSVITGVASLLVGLLVLVLAFASVGLTLPGCSGV